MSQPAMEEWTFFALPCCCTRGWDACGGVKCLTRDQLPPLLQSLEVLAWDRALCPFRLALLGLAALAACEPFGAVRETHRCLWCELDAAETSRLCMTS